MSHTQNNHSDRRTFRYLERFYHEAQKCIDNGSIVELVYGSYVVAVYSLIGGVSIRMAIDNCHQFCRSLVALESWMVDDDERMWLETLWQKLLSSLYYICRDNIMFDGVNEPFLMIQSIERLQRLLLNSSSLLPSLEEVSSVRLSMTTEWICQKLISLAVYMHYYFDHFLFLETFRPGTDETRFLRTVLIDILGRIVHLIPQISSIRDYIFNAYPSQWEMESCTDGQTTDFLSFPNVRIRGINSHPKERDMALALLYTFSRLLKDMLEPPTQSYEKTARINQSAIALCRLCASFPSHSFNPVVVTLLVKRSLFWAGMVLTKSRFPHGNAQQFYSDQSSPNMDKE